MKYIISCLLLLFSVGLFGQKSKPLKVGEEIIQKYESQHPYRGSKFAGEEIVWKQEIYLEGASYIAFHFSRIQLSEGDYILLKSSDGSGTWKYYNQDILNTVSTNKGFWSIPIYGDKAIIEIHSINKKGNYGYYIDKIAKGYPQRKLKSDEETETCGQDDSENAICYQNSHPIVYNRSRPVARLLINGTSICTGWLVGSEGHLLTCNHCIRNASDAYNLTIEFMAEGAECNTNCQTRLGCPGKIEATSTTLIQTDENLDYSLLLLPNNVSSTYGYLQLREKWAVQNEQIYIPNHPKGWGKRIAYFSDHPDDAQGVAHIQSLTEPRCSGTGNDIGYYADTQTGSSGSPVIATFDHLVVALHHCGSCPNLGVPIEKIITDLGDNIPDNALNGCPDNLNITNTLEVDRFEHLANNSITATNKIINGAIVHYGANSLIRLLTGFRVYSNATFQADLNGCTPTTKSVTIKESYAELDEELSNDIGKITEKAISIYPNPTNGTFIIEQPGKIYESTCIEITDITGCLVFKKITNQTGPITIDISDKPNGIYIVKIIQGNDMNTYKIIKE